MSQPSLTVIYVTYTVESKVDMTWLHGKDYVERFSKTFLDRAKAEEFAATVKDPAITTHEETSCIFTAVSCGNPYFFLDHTNVVTLGNFQTVRGAYSSTAYTTTELESVARIEYDRLKKIELKNSDSFYSHYWG